MIRPVSRRKPSLRPQSIGARTTPRCRSPALWYTAVGAVTVEGYEHVEAALDAGRGAILALPHLGGWEWAGRWLASRGVEVVSVVERLEPPELLDWFGDLRASLGITVHPAGPEVVAELRAVLDRNGVVCLLSDRDVTGGGYEVEFCGERTRLPAGPAVLALRSGARVLPTAASPERKGSRRVSIQYLV